MQVNFFLTVDINSRRPGRDEKGCLLSTEKKAAVNVDRRCRPVEKGRLHFSTGQHQPNKKNLFLKSADMNFFLFFKIMS